MLTPLIIFCIWWVQKYTIKIAYKNFQKQKQPIDIFTINSKKILVKILDKVEFEKWRDRTWVGWVASLRGWRASVGGMGGVLAWVEWVAC